MACCSLCQGQLWQFMDFGDVALAGAFLKSEQFSQEKLYPLRVGFCEACYSVQVMDHVDPDVLFRGYFYRSSDIGTVREHMKDYATSVVSRFQPRTVLEIGCNDGVMLRHLNGMVEQAIGVDPSDVVPADLPVINDYFTKDVAKEVGKVDLVVGSNVFAHVSDLNALTEAVSDVLDDGVFVFECHYLGAMIEGLQYDVIYHEHVYYHSLSTLQAHFSRHGMTVFDAELVRLHAGSIRVYVGKGMRLKTPRLWALLQAEFVQGLHKPETYEKFAFDALEHREELVDTLNGLRGRVIGYGASGRANSLIQYCGIDLPYIVDDSPARQGLYTPGSHIPIRSSEALSAEYVLLFAWSYLEEIRRKCSVPMIVPFPKPSVVEPCSV